MLTVLRTATWRGWVNVDCTATCPLQLFSYVSTSRGQSRWEWGVPKYCYIPVYTLAYTGILAHLFTIVCQSLHCTVFQVWSMKRLPYKTSNKELMGLRMIKLPSHLFHLSLVKCSKFEYKLNKWYNWHMILYLKWDLLRVYQKTPWGTPLLGIYHRAPYYTKYRLKHMANFKCR